MAAKKIICDTDVMIDYWDEKKSRHDATKIILENKIGLDNVILSAVTKMELMCGANNKRYLEKINKKLAGFNIALINPDITLKAVDLLQEYFLSHGLSLPDCLIASTALTTGLELFTYNIKDFKFISHLVLYKL